MLKSKLLSATAAAPEAIAIEDVFSTYLYTGNGSTQTITNGIDLAGEGGLVWLKDRLSASLGFHVVYNTENGTGPDGGRLFGGTASTNALSTQADGLQSFNSDGFTLGSNTYENGSGKSFASWTFRKAPRFFDVVTYTGTGSARTVSHNLGLAPGCIIVKRTNTTGDWQVYHRSNTAAPETDYLVLNSTAATVDSNTRWNDTAPTDSVFTVGTEATVNASGGTYVAYLFAHDPLGPSGDGSDGLIACGSYTAINGTAKDVNLGFEPQWVLVKRTDSTGYWWIQDSMRGWCAANSGDSQKYLQANDASAEKIKTTDGLILTSTGFTVPATSSDFNSNGTYIYIAIRRGPMREPTSGTEVFEPQLSTTPPTTGNTYTSSLFTVDSLLQRHRTNAANWSFTPRMTNRILMPSSTAAEQATQYNDFGATQSGVKWIANWSNDAGNYINYWLRRAPGFFDVVAYTGDGVAGRTVSHNLGVAPEMMWLKRRDANGNWGAYHTATGPTKVLIPNTTAAASTNSLYWNNTDPTADGFIINTALNTSNYIYIAYLFATLPGISKVGSYTGNGSSQTINCGFTGGARFVLIKRTDSSGDWYVWDTARGIVSGNDPHLSLNTTAAEVTSDDTIDPDSSGFIVNQVAATNVNVSSASYIFLAIA